MFLQQRCFKALLPHGIRHGIHSALAALLLSCLYFYGSIFQPCFAAAWTQTKGNAQVIEQIYAGTMLVKPENSIEFDYTTRLDKLEYKIYGEVGVTNNLTVGGFVNSSLRTLRSSGSSVVSSKGLATEASVDMIELFVRRKILDVGGFVVSNEIITKFAGLYEQDARFGLYKKQRDLEYKLLLGYGLPSNIPFLTTYGGQSHFLAADFGYRYRDNLPFDEIRMGLGVGLRPAINTLLMGQIFTVTNVYGIDKNKLSPAPIQSRNLNYQKLSQFNIKRDGLIKGQVSVVVQTSATNAIQIGITKDISGQNSFHEKGILFSVWHYFD